MNSLVEYIQNYKSSNPTGWRKWLLGAFVALLTVVVVAVLVIQATLRSRELARLQAERDRAKEALHAAQVNAKLAANDQDKEEHLGRAELALERVELLETEVKALAETHDARKAVIDSIRTWEDVDRRVR